MPSVCPPARDNILFQIMAGPESPFTEAQLKEIILQHGKLGGPTRVRRWFMKQYKDIPNSRIPSARQFGKVIARFEKNGSIHKQNNGSPTRSGRPSTTLASALRPALPPEAITLSTSLRRQGGTLRSSLGQSSEYYIFNCDTNISG